MAQNVQQNKLDAGVSYQTTLGPAARTATANGTGIDTTGFRLVEIVFQVGTITDGTHALKVQESPDNATWNDVAAADLAGTAPGNAASNTNQKVAYIGAKRYVRAVSTVSGATTGGVYGALVVLGRPRIQPVTVV